MIPQYNEPCLKCANLKKLGPASFECTKGRYNSASMIIFGACGFFNKKNGRPFKAKDTPTGWFDDDMED